MKLNFSHLMAFVFALWLGLALSQKASTATWEFTQGGSSSSSGASLTADNSFTGANTFTGGSAVSTFTVVSNSSSTFNGPVRLNKNAFVFGPGSLAIGGVGDPSATSAYFGITRSGATNMAIEMYQDTTLRAEFAVNSSNHLSIQAISGDVNINAAGGQTLRLKNNAVTQIAVDTSLVTVSTNTNVDGTIGLWNRTTAQLNGTPGIRYGALVLNTTTGDVCMSTGTGVSPWVRLVSTTTACD